MTRKFTDFLPPMNRYLFFAVVSCLLCILFILGASGDDETPTVPIGPTQITRVTLASMPDKTQYMIGESLDLGGAKLMIEYSSGSPATAEIEGNAFCKVSGFDSSSSGKKTITVTYTYASSSHSVTFDVEVIAITEIEITSKPSKLNYFVGDVEDHSGLAITVRYSNGQSELLTSGFSISGFDSSSEGEKTVTVSYKGFSADYTVNVVEPKLTNISITSSAEKTAYFEGDPFDATGLKVSAEYENGMTVDVTAMIIIEGFVSKVGTYDITLSFSDDGITRTAFYSVTVISVGIVSIEIDTLPTKLEYLEGETLDTSGLIVIANYNNGNTEIVTDGLTYGGFDSDTVGEKVVEISLANFTASFTVTVSVGPDHVHKEGEFIVEIEPDCTTPGSESNYCTVCFEHVSTREIAALGHTPGEWQITVEPNCTEAGEKKHYCTVCSELVETREVSALGHTFGESIVTKEPTATEEGIESSICSVCGYIQEIAIDKLSNTVSNGDYTATLKTESAVFPFGSEFAGQSVFGSMTSDEINAVMSSLGEYSMIDAWEMSFNDKDGAVIVIEGEIEFCVPAVLDLSEYASYKIVDADGRIYDVTVDGTSAVLTAPVSGRYMLIGELIPETTVPDTTLTPDDTTVAPGGDNTTDDIDGERGDGNAVKIVVIVVASVVLAALIVGMVYMYVIKKYY